MDVTLRPSLPISHHGDLIPMSNMIAIEVSNTYRHALRYSEITGIMLFKILR